MATNIIIAMVIAFFLCALTIEFCSLQKILCYNEMKSFGYAYDNMCMGNGSIDCLTCRYYRRSIYE